MAFRFSKTRERYNRQPDWLEDLSEKSYLFEILDLSGKVDSSFLFSCPPESEEIAYTFRNAQTKVFSGLHVDDYGVDAAHITLSGSTINSRLRKINVDGSPKNVTGEQEIYKFRDTVLRYKTYMNGTEQLTYQFIMTDLSKMATHQNRVIKDNEKGQTDGETYSANQYDITFNEFKISRDKSKPFTYNYTIDMTAVAVNEGKAEKESAAEDKQTLLAKILAACADIEAKVDGVNNAVSGFYSGVVDAVDDVRVASMEMTRVIGKAAGISSNAINETANALTDVTNTVFAIPQDVIGIMLNIVDDLINASNNFVKAIDNCKENILSLGTQGYWVPQSMLDKINMDAHELEISARKLANQLDELRNDIIVFVTNISGDITTYVETRITSIGQSVVINNNTYYGSTEYQLKENDTIEMLSMSNYGNLDHIEDILMYNKIASLSDCEAGDKIRIPLLNPSQSQTQDIIAYQRGQVDVYGKDVALDDDGFVQVKDNDFALTSGVNTLNQAILLRLKDTLNHRVRLNTYGIRMSLGGGKEASTYIATSIYNTILSDPRVLTIEALQYQGSGDSLIVDVKYKDVNNRINTMIQRV
ncbi:MAG: hypothetical protein Ta2A_11880 [Treponemataceae bacterium]|nr:MAG: hypothetical protein Ta2A_11880 [Treponemataceae bacterium]